jgi:hypothetical protein
VSSDQGCTATIDQHVAAEWSVKRTVAGLEPCPDGTAVDGIQHFRFYPSNPSGVPDLDSQDLYVGEDLTSGPNAVQTHPD